MREVKPILMSHTISNLANYCMRKFELMFMFGNRPARESGYAADVGTALHNGTQTYLIALADGHDHTAAEAKGFIEFLKAFPFDLEQEQKSQSRSFENAVLLLTNLFESPIWDEWELVQVDGHGWAVEVPFIIRHTTTPGIIHAPEYGGDHMFVTQGKIDLIMRHKVSGKIRTLDIKTTLLDERLWEGEYKFSGQQIGYTHVLNAMLGIDPESFEVGYVIACFSGDHPRVEYYPLEKPSEVIEDYWRTQLDTLTRIKEYIEQGWFPRRNGGCVTWSSPCNALSICSSRDHKLIKRWFEAIDSEPIETYDYWVEMEL